MSPAVQAVLGYEPDRLVGTRGWALVHEGDAQSAQVFHAELLEQRADRGRSSFAGSTATARGDGSR